MLVQYVACILLVGGFVYTGLGARLVASFGGRVLGCGDTPVWYISGLFQ